MTFAQCWRYHNANLEHSESSCNIKEFMNLVFANQNEEDSIYSLTTREISEAQKQDPDRKTQADNKCFSTQLVEDITEHCKGNKIVIPKNLQYLGVVPVPLLLQNTKQLHLEETVVF